MVLGGAGPGPREHEQATRRCGTAIAYDATAYLAMSGTAVGMPYDTAARSAVLSERMMLRQCVTKLAYSATKMRY
eukprot:2769850-Rhodomonas_salina.2